MSQCKCPAYNNNTVLVLGISERTEGTEKLLRVEGGGGGRFYCHKRARAADVQRRTRQVSSVCQNYSDLVLVLIKQFREKNEDRFVRNMRHFIFSSSFLASSKVFNLFFKGCV